MNNEDFVTYEHAVVLNKLGFREKCDYIYRFENNPLYSLEKTIIRKEYCVSWNNSRDCCSAPTLAQAQKWFRKEKKYSVEPHYNNTYWDVEIINMNNEDCYEINNCFVCYEEALSVGITECLKMLQNN